jgi:hypothetical protein
MSVGFFPLVYLYYYDRKTYKREISFEDQLLQVEKKKKILTVQETRLLGERMASKEVPEADDSNGYM